MTINSKSHRMNDLSPRLVLVLLAVLVTVWLLPHRSSIQSPTPNQSYTAVQKHNSTGGFLPFEIPKMPSWSSSPSKPGKHDLLVIYVYHETGNAFENAQFFIQNGLHGSADFIFVLNGDAPLLEPLLPSGPNIEVFRKDNTCFDLGTYGHVVRKKNLLKSGYKQFILMNASVRGPFMPTWSKDCWSTAWLSKLSDTMKLQGMTVNCARRFHVQSMIFGTDKAGLESMMNDGTFDCAETLFPDAVAQEVDMASKIISHGWDVNAWMTAYHGDSIYEDRENCGAANEMDPTFGEGWYFGFNLHPYETIFMKANRNVNPLMMAKMTEWHMRMNYSSYDYC